MTKVVILLASSSSSSDEDKEEIRELKKQLRFELEVVMREIDKWPTCFAVSQTFEIWDN